MGKNNQNLADAIKPINLGLQNTAIQAIFAVIMALGFRYLVEATYSFFTPLTVVGSSEKQINSIIYLFPILVMTFLGLRFFWVVANVRRFLVRSNKKLAQKKEIKGAKSYRDSIQRQVVLLHVPIVLIHGFLFYFGCRIAHDLLFSQETQKGVVYFVAFYSIYQYINSIWLWLLTLNFDIQVHGKAFREKVWKWNNIVISTLGLVILVLGVGLKKEIEDILQVACLIFLSGSILDLAVTSFHYLESHDS